MGLIVNKVLAQKITSRIEELLCSSGLTLLGLAVLCDIGRSSIKSYYSATLPVSAEILDKICKPFRIDLSHFFAFDNSLPANLKNQPTIKAFYKKYEGKGLGYFRSEEEVPQKPAEQTRKYERDTIAHIVLKTNYFDTAHLVGQMITDFARDHNLILESGRLYELLAKYVDKELEKIETTKRPRRARSRKRRCLPM